MCKLGDAEVDELEMAFAGDEDILRLQVPVDDAALVRRGQSLGHLGSPFERSPKRQHPFRQSLSERLAPEELRDEIPLPVLETDVVQRDDVGVAQSAGHPRFAFQRGA